MAKPLARSAGPIDTDSIAWAVREVLLGQMTEEQPAPATARLWAGAVKLAALMLTLAALRMLGAGMGWNA